MPNEQQERFDAMIENIYEFGNYDKNLNPYIKSFIDEEVSLAVANREKEIVEMIESVKATKNDSFSHALEQFKKIIINLISKNNDKQSNTRRLFRSDERNTR